MRDTCEEWHDGNMHVDVRVVLGFGGQRHDVGGSNTAAA